MKVLVLTETDACCGPMAAAFLRDYSPSLDVVSAGEKPLQSIDPMVVEVMRESLINLEAYLPLGMEKVDEADFDVVYRCPEKECPKTMEGYRELRDYIKNEAFLFFREMEKQQHLFITSCPNRFRISRVTSCQANA